MEDVCLNAVGVLVLVDENVVEPGPHRPAGRRLERGAPVEEEIVEVDDVVLSLALGVGPEQLSQRDGVLGTPREPLLEHGAEALLGVDGPGVDGGDRLRLGEPSRRRIDVGVGSHEAEQVGGVRLVENGEALTEADRGAVAAEEPIGDGVERPAPHATRGGIA